MNADEWVLIVRNTARQTYQILDFGELDAKKTQTPVWKRVLYNAIATGCALYGIPRSALDFIWA